MTEPSSSPSQVSDAHPGMASEHSALAQAIVADQGSISAISFSTLDNNCPELFKIRLNTRQLQQKCQWAKRLIQEPKSLWAEQRVTVKGL